MNSPILTLLAVHAHPDDEAFSTGGVLARAALDGVRTVLVCATRGECGGHDDPQGSGENGQERLAALREQELRESCAVLGVADVYLLGYRDSGMAGTPANADPRTLTMADPEEVAGRLTRIIRQTRPQVVITYDQQGGYGHPDHIATHRATVTAVDAAADRRRFPEHGLPPWSVQKLYYTVRSRAEIDHMEDVLRRHGFTPPDRPGFKRASAVPDEVVTTRVDVRPHLERKRAALRMHRTQLDGDSVLLTVPNEVAREGWGVESFQRVFTRVPVPDQEQDLFEGLRSDALMCEEEVR